MSDAIMMVFFLGIHCFDILEWYIEREGNIGMILKPLWVGPTFFGMRVYMVNLLIVASGPSRPDPE
jgi:hypothetical protein